MSASTIKLENVSLTEFQCGEQLLRTGFNTPMFGPDVPRNYILTGVAVADQWNGGLTVTFLSKCGEEVKPTAVY